MTPLEYPLADALKATGLSYSLCDKFNFYSSDRSLCPLFLCGSFPSLFIAGSLH
ncbi:type II toxin-antitoxin system VapB family antitoxin [Microcystis aeruginosa]|uniref:type II toxin-antitoxin system VapB family antitoxin n=1 Tax=Microcystis aeruginosa TaxID=1126 RepID=UPI00352A1E6A